MFWVKSVVGGEGWERGREDGLPLPDGVWDSGAGYFVEVELHLLFWGGCCHLDLLNQRGFWRQGWNQDIQTLFRLG